MTDLHHRYGILEQDGALILPVLHHRMEYADLVRRAIAELAPDAVAVEYPDTLMAPLRAAVNRLPQISVLLYEDDEGNSVYLPVEPADAFVEAVRSASAAELPLRLIDLDVDYPLRHTEPFPDTYAVLRIGAGAYLDAYLDASAGEKPHELDLRRELGMAHRVQAMLEQHERVLVVVGMAHARRLHEALQTSQPAPFARARRDKVGLFNLAPSSLGEVLTSFPFLAAVYERRRRGLPRDPEQEQMAPPRRKAKVADFLSVIDGTGKDEQPSEEEGLTAAVDWVSRRAHDGEGEGAEHLRPLDRRRVQRELLDRASARYHDRTGEEYKGWQRRVLHKFARNMALQEGRLLPDFYQLLVAARGAVDQNFCYELWLLGEHYPWQRASAEIPTIEVTAEMLNLGTRRIHLRRFDPVAKRRMLRVPFNKRKHNKFKRDWLEHFDPSGLCSHPPEDIVIEDYGAYLRKKGVKLVGEDQARTEPFTSSLKDGIDVRETLRNWHEGQIYVRDDRRVRGGVGSVVIIFDEDDGPQERCSFRMTWLGEHDQESDMAFYSTELLDQVVGPGINRCEYGGLMLSYPPLRLFDVWEDPDYQAIRLKSEVLLMAAIDYSLEPHVVYVAADPPRSAMRSYAERRQRKIIYVPIGQLSPTSMKKIRVFHVLWGKDKRNIADDYIW